MSNFAKGFRRAGTGRIPGCDRVPKRPVPRAETRIASPQTEDANRPYDHDPEP